MIINNSHLCSTFDHKAYYKQLCIYASTHTRAEPVCQHSAGPSILLSHPATDASRCCIMVRYLPTSTYILNAGIVTLSTPKNPSLCNSFERLSYATKIAARSVLGFVVLIWGFFFLGCSMISTAGIKPGITLLTLAKSPWGLGIVTEVAKRLFFPSHPGMLLALLSPEKGQCSCFGRSNAGGKWAEGGCDTVIQHVA